MKRNFKHLFHPRGLHIPHYVTLFTSCFSSSAVEGLFMNVLPHWRRSFLKQVKKAQKFIFKVRTTLSYQENCVSRFVHDVVAISSDYWCFQYTSPYPNDRAVFWPATHRLMNCTNYRVASWQVRSCITFLPFQHNHCGQLIHWLLQVIWSNQTFSDVLVHIRLGIQTKCMEKAPLT